MICYTKQYSESTLYKLSGKVLLNHSNGAIVLMPITIVWEKFNVKKNLLLLGYDENQMHESFFLINKK